MYNKNCDTLLNCVDCKIMTKCCFRYIFGKYRIKSVRFFVFKQRLLVYAGDLCAKPDALTKTAFNILQQSSSVETEKHSSQWLKLRSQTARP